MPVLPSSRVRLPVRKRMNEIICLLVKHEIFFARPGLEDFVKLVIRTTLEEDAILRLKKLGIDDEVTEIFKAIKGEPDAEG